MNSPVAGLFHPGQNVYLTDSIRLRGSPYTLLGTVTDELEAQHEVGYRRLLLLD